MLVGAASKGIIQRDFQHNAMVYKSAYQKNPFDGITDEVYIYIVFCKNENNSETIYRDNKS